MRHEISSVHGHRLWILNIVVAIGWDGMCGMIDEGQGCPIDDDEWVWVGVGP